MANRRTFRKTFPLVVTAGGAGNEFHSIGTIGGRGILAGIQIRRDSGDTITTDVLPFWVGEEDDLADTPLDDIVAAKTASIVLTPSDTAASLDTDLDKPRRFTNGLRVGGDFTFSGAGTSTTYWTVWGETH